jgi:cardiolipin synthase
MVASPFVASALASGSYTTALYLTAACALSDAADGAIARRWPSQASLSGSFLDPLADKIFTSSTAIGLCMSPCGILSIPLASLMLFKDGGLLVGTVVARVRATPAPRTVSRLLAVQTVAPLQVKPSFTAKANMVMTSSLLLGGVALAAAGIADDMALLATLAAAPADPALVVPPATTAAWANFWNSAQIVTGVTTFASGWEYLRLFGSQRVFKRTER